MNASNPEATAPAQAADDQPATDNGDTSQSVHVPNITPGAVSGIDHEPLPTKPASQLAGSQRRTEEVPEGQSDPYAGVGSDPAPDPSELPDTQDTTVVGDPDTTPIGGVDQTDGAGQDEAPSAPTDSTEGHDQLQEVTGGDPAPGETVQSDTAGTGEAVNADTGQVTAPGEQLPDVQEKANEPGPDPSSDATLTDASHPGSGDLDGGGVDGSAASDAPESTSPAEQTEQQAGD